MKNHLKADSWKQPIPVNLPEFGNDLFGRTLFQILLLRCANSDQAFYREGISVILKRGECVVGRDELGKCFGLKQNEHLRVYRKLVRLKKVNNIINITNHGKFSVITVLNYDDYVRFEQQNEQHVNNRRTTGEHKQDCIDIKIAATYKQPANFKTDLWVKAISLVKDRLSQGEKIRSPQKIAVLVYNDLLKGQNEMDSLNADLPENIKSSFKKI